MAWCFATLGIRKRPIVGKWRELPRITERPYRAKSALTCFSSVTVLDVQGRNSTTPRTQAHPACGLE